jgi:F0F1-type ATP synthase membrane subunit c/vacuolar-type H+-ATPase subunit K
VAVAELFGAVNLGTAFGVGQVVFALTVAFLIIRT